MAENIIDGTAAIKPKANSFLKYQTWLVGNKSEITYSFLSSPTNPNGSSIFGVDSSDLLPTGRTVEK